MTVFVQSDALQNLTGRQNVAVNGFPLHVDNTFHIRIGEWTDSQYNNNVITETGWSMSFH